jgi:hypothetical protein
MKKILRMDVFKLIAKCRKKFSSPEVMNYFLESDDPKDHSKNKIIDMVYEMYSGTNNGYLSDLYEAITGCQIEVIGDVSKRFSCSCCHLKTLSEKHHLEDGTEYDICDYCFWEDDGTTEVNLRSSVNRGSILEYRKKIKLHSNFYNKNKWKN